MGASLPQSLLFSSRKITASDVTDLSKNICSLMMDHCSSTDWQSVMALVA